VRICRHSVPSHKFETQPGNLAVTRTSKENLLSVLREQTQNLKRYYFRKSPTLIDILCTNFPKLPEFPQYKNVSLHSLYEGIIIIIIITIIIIIHGLGRLTSSGIEALSSFPGASMISSSSSRFVVEGVFQKSGVVHSFEMVDPVLFVFGFHVLYSRDL